MRSKNLLIALIVLLAISCKKPIEPNANTFLLTKVETYASADSLSSDSPNYQEYLYDSQGQIIEKRLVNGNKLGTTYKVEHDDDGHIIKISVIYERDESKANEYIESFIWAGDSIVSKRVYMTVQVENIVHELGVNRLPISKRSYNDLYKSTKMGVIYDANSNVSLQIGLISPQENYEFDLSIYNPFACTYDLRLFTMLSYPHASFLPFINMSRNWIIERNNGTVEKVVKMNSVGYPTVTKSASFTSVFNTVDDYSIHYLYNQ